MTGETRDRRHSVWRLGSAAAGLATSLAAGPAPAQDQGRLVTLLGIRSATVAPDGLGFASLGLSTARTDADGGDDDADGSLVLGFGLGSAADGIGLQATANVTSLTDAFGDSGSLGLKASRQVASGGTPTFLAASADRIASWGDATEVDESLSLIATAFPQVELGGATYPLMLTLGAGTGLRDDFSEAAAFGGVGVGLTRNLGTSLAWTGEAVTVGAAFRVPGLDTLRFSASVGDVFDQEDSRRLTLSATVFVEDLFGG